MKKQRDHAQLNSKRIFLKEQQKNDIFSFDMLYLHFCLLLICKDFGYLSFY